MEMEKGKEAVRRARCNHWRCAAPCCSLLASQLPSIPAGARRRSLPHAMQGSAKKGSVPSTT
eukprot:3649987-Rhodomonas_salina.1